MLTVRSASGSPTRDGDGGGMSSATLLQLQRDYEEKLERERTLIRKREVELEERARYEQQLDGSRFSRDRVNRGGTRGTGEARGGRPSPRVGHAWPPLQVSSTEVLRTLWIWTHATTGLALVVVYVAHQLAPRLSSPAHNR